MGDSSQGSRCIFCGGKNLSKEEIFPHWINRILPPGQTVVRHDKDQMQKLVGRQMTRQFSGSGKFQRPHGLGPKAIKVVCTKCNNGWMSSLQDAAKHPMTPLIHGNWGRLSDKDCTALATWATMHSMVRQFADNSRAIGSDELKRFYGSQRALSNWYIWVARYTGTGPDRISSFSAIRPKPLPGTPTGEHFVGHTHVSFIIAGQLIFHCVSSTRTDIFPFLNSRYNERLGFAPIWFGAALSFSSTPTLIGDRDFMALRDNTTNALLSFFNDRSDGARFHAS